MELKHLRKGKINKIKTVDLSRELDKLEARQTRYEKDIADNELRCEILFERLVNSGEGTNTCRWYFDSTAETQTKIEWSDDKEEWHKLNSIIGNAKHALKKMQKKKKLIEDEMIDRTLTGEA